MKKQVVIRFNSRHYCSYWMISKISVFNDINKRKTLNNNCKIIATWQDFCFYIYIVDFSNIIMSFISKDFLNADANCPGYVITAFEMIERLKNQGAEGKMNQSYL